MESSSRNNDQTPPREALSPVAPSPLLPTKWKSLSTLKPKPTKASLPPLIMKAIAKMSKRITDYPELSLLARIVCYPQLIVTISWAIAD
jgi:hypothetical protein